MKINFVLPGFGSTGGIKVALKYADALRKAGHDVICYAPRITYNLGKYNKLELLARRLYRLFFPAEVKETRRKYPGLRIIMPLSISDDTIRDADKTIATAWCTAFDVANLSQRKGEKIYFIQGYEVWDDEKRGKESYKLPMKHIVISKWIDDILVNKLGCHPGIIVHNGVDTNVFQPGNTTRGDNSVRFLMLYHNLSSKGVEDGLAAYKSLVGKYEGISLNMFGQYAYPEKPNYVSNYYFNPTLDELVQLYQEADIFIFPSREEGWGLTPVEAMACGCAVAGTNVGCMLEIGVDKENVLLSEPYDVIALASNLEQLLINKPLRKKISENSIKTIKELDWNKSYEAFFKAINV
jgi:glycosyltransferase involved in cell wall biosynthesis